MQYTKYERLMLIAKKKRDKTEKLIHIEKEIEKEEELLRETILETGLIELGAELALNIKAENSVLDIRQNTERKKEAIREAKEKLSRVKFLTMEMVEIASEMSQFGYSNSEIKAEMNEKEKEINTMIAELMNTVDGVPNEDY